MFKNANYRCRCLRSFAVFLYLWWLIIDFEINVKSKFLPQKSRKKIEKCSQSIFLYRTQPDNESQNKFWREILFQPREVFNNDGLCDKNLWKTFEDDNSVGLNMKELAASVSILFLQFSIKSCQKKYFIINLFCIKVPNLIKWHLFWCFIL